MVDVISEIQTHAKGTRIQKQPLISKATNHWYHTGVDFLQIFTAFGLVVFDIQALVLRFKCPHPEHQLGFDMFYKFITLPRNFEIYKKCIYLEQFLELFFTFFHTVNFVSICNIRWICVFLRKQKSPDELQQHLFAQTGFKKNLNSKFNKSNDILKNSLKAITYNQLSFRF